MICCDTCPYNPTCEDHDQFIRDIFGLDDGEDVYDDWQEAEL